MTKQQALSEFKALGITVTGDSIHNREEWSYYTDALCKSGFITLKQYESWANPF